MKNELRRNHRKSRIIRIFLDPDDPEGNPDDPEQHLILKEGPMGHVCIFSSVYLDYSLRYRRKC